MDNGDVTGQSPLSSLLVNNFWGEHMSAPNAQHLSYRPLTVLTFRLNHLAHGLDVYGYHVVNVVLHAVASVLVVAVARKVLRLASVLLALIFI